MEIWKPILGFESLYEVSNLGRCRRIKRGKKLDAESVDEIKTKLAAGQSMLSIAKQHGVSVPTIVAIRNGSTWTGDHKFRELKPHQRTDFYYNFLLCKESKYTHYTAHRAVWEAFNGKIPEGFEINHKNLDRADNRLENLEVLTRKENILHAFEHYKKTHGTHRTGGIYYERKKERKKKRDLRKQNH
jgi:hypothetical protein